MNKRLSPRKRGPIQTLFFTSLFLAFCTLSFFVLSRSSFPQISLLSLIAPNSLPSPSDSPSSVPQASVLRPPSEVYPAKPWRSGVIRYVHDGDTIYAKNIKEGIRLIGIDAPELAYSYINCKNPLSERCLANECGALEAKNKLKELILNKEVYLISDENVGDKDKYNRLLRYVYLCLPREAQKNCLNISLELLRSGLVRQASFGTNYSKLEEYEKAELEAKNKNLGIWGKCQNN